MLGRTRTYFSMAEDYWEKAATSAPTPTPAKGKTKKKNVNPLVMIIAGVLAVIVVALLVITCGLSTKLKKYQALADEKASGGEGAIQLATAAPEKQI